MRAFFEDINWVKKNNLLRETLLWIFAATAIRYLLICFVPLANDEAYYWDWGRILHLSYYDHPPGVSWLTWFSRMIFERSMLPEALSVRGSIPILHAAATLGILGIANHTAQDRIQNGEAKSILRRLMVLTQVTPIFFLGGVFLMPDAGLMLFVTLSVWFIISKLNPNNTQSLSVVDGITLGVLCGLAGLFKYHAVALCGGALGTALFLRRSTIAKDSGLWVATVTTGLIACSPVWIWNYLNDMASLSFQTSHGFGGLSFNSIFAFQLLVGLVLFFSPYILWYLGNSIFRSLSALGSASEKNADQKYAVSIIVGSSLPLLAIIAVLAPFKQLLPHWAVPALWLLIPVAAIRAPAWPRCWRLNAAASVALVACLAAIVSIPSLRNLAIEAAKNRPAGLGEMTVWKPLVADPRVAELARTATILGASDRESCPKPFAWASLRWYSVAQISFALPGKPKVYSVEPNRYYYHYRDYLRDLAGCTVLAIGETGHYDANWFAKNFTSSRSGELTAPGHDDRPFTWVLGKMAP